MRLIAWLTLALLCGCDDSTVVVCFGDQAFCARTFKLVVMLGADQTVASGDLVTLDGSSSNGDIKSYSWSQTGGPTIALSNAGSARATFVAPRVASATDLTFQLTVVDGGHQAETGSTHVTVQPPAAVALARATQLLAGPLRPQSVAVQPSRTADGCPVATVDLSPQQAAAQIGLWLGARAMGITRGVDGDDPSAFFDAARVLVAERGVTRDIAGQIESFGFALLGALLEERLGGRDPALHDAIIEHLKGATLPSDPAALLIGHSEVRHSAGITIETVDSTVSMQRAVATLLKSRGGCVQAAQALDLTGASLRVITASRAVE